MRNVELIGVPFDGYGRQGNQANAPHALREAGIGKAFDGHDVSDTGDIELPAFSTERGSKTSMINEPGLLGMTASLHQRVAESIGNNRFPFVFGGDCSALLGITSGLHALPNRTGLLFIDGHEDTMPLDTSMDGEAANSEVGLMLGLTGKLMSGELADFVPTLDRDQICLVGQRDGEWRRQFNVGSLKDHGVWMRYEDEVAEDAADTGRAAVDHLRKHNDNWWLHIDLDVLDPQAFFAQGLPGIEDEPGGLTWSQLTSLAGGAVSSGDCIGWSIAIYDPDQDERRTDAANIVEFVHEIAGRL